jgi:hypothetical protein
MVSFHASLAVTCDAQSYVTALPYPPYPFPLLFRRGDF